MTEEQRSRSEATPPAVPEAADIGAPLGDMAPTQPGEGLPLVPDLIAAGSGA